VDEKENEKGDWCDGGEGIDIKNVVGVKECR